MNDHQRDQSGLFCLCCKSGPFDLEAYQAHACAQRRVVGYRRNISTALISALRALAAPRLTAGSSSESGAAPPAQPAPPASPRNLDRPVYRNKRENR